MNKRFEHPISVAPMMQRTDRHFRYFMRQISRRTLLYTEMITSGAIIHGDREYLLGYDKTEHPISLQTGGDDPKQMAEVARIAEDWGYDEVNINVGCPSDRVQNGNFGACLMKDPARVARCVEAMIPAVSIPITVKHRIGVDDLDQYEDMENFVRIVRDAGCERFTVHARKAWLQGLSPRQNRNVPPLRYDDVYRLKEVFPELVIEINGGVRDLDSTADHLDQVDAVMIGRAAYEHPFLFADVDRRFYGDPAVNTARHDIVESMYDYIDRWVSAGGKLHHISRHMLTLFSGQLGAKAWRRHLSENAFVDGANFEVVQAALQHVPRELAA